MAWSYTERVHLHRQGGDEGVQDGGEGRAERVRALLAIALLIGLLWPTVALADITGKPRVIDGDTLEIAGERIRLHGIDAPESGQTCVADGMLWHCGMEAASSLAFKIARGWVGCQGQDRDRYGRLIAVCYAGGVGGPELNAWLVSEGWALAYRQYSTDYVVEEQAAGEARRGLWRGGFIAPWEWRRGKRLQAATVPDSASDCRIKGNISSSGERIYHVPGGSYYDRTKITAAKGERWFCTEREAVAAGWRKAKR